MNGFSLAQGITVPNLTGIHECYEIAQRDAAFVFIINVSVENIQPLIKSFFSELEEPCFLIIEVPTNEADERSLRFENTSPFHCDVYYCNALPKQALFELIEKYADFLIHDGMVCFGIASHSSHDELFIGKYKVAKIFTANEQRYKKLMDKMRIPFEETIKTVWDNFSKQEPGETRSISIGGKNIYNVLDELKEYGLFFAERREQ